MLKYIFIFFIIFAISSCCQKPECETLTQDDLEWVPYMYQDKELTFVNAIDSNDSVVYSIKIYEPSTQKLNDFGECDHVCGESIYVDYIYSLFSFTIYRAYNQMGLNPRGSRSIPGDDYLRIGFNSGTFYNTFQTSYHSYNDVYKYLDDNDTIWYAKNYGIIKFFKNDNGKIYELKN